MRADTQELIEEHKDHLFAVAFNVCRTVADAEDVVQDAFIAYHTSSKDFEDEEHIKAWLLRVTVNKAVSVTRQLWRRKSVPLDDYMDTLAFEDPQAESLFAEVMRLPQKQRVAVHLFYYEDLSVREVAQVLKISEGAVKTRLSRGRKQLKRALKEEWSDES